MSQKSSKVNSKGALVSRRLDVTQSSQRNQRKSSINYSQHLESSYISSKSNASKIISKQGKKTK